VSALFARGLFAAGESQGWLPEAGEWRQKTLVFRNQPRKTNTL
jgi:hypothetical protein